MSALIYPMGTISAGTLRPADLIAAFAGELQRLATLALGNAHYAIVDDTTARAHLASADQLLDLSEDDEESEDTSDLVDELCEQLEQYAAPYFRFGTLEGDGADFGFWLDHEAFESACADGEVIKVKDLSEAQDAFRDHVADDRPLSAAHVAVVNDHGNVTLYRPRLEFDTVWSVV